MRLPLFPVLSIMLALPAQAEAPRVLTDLPPVAALAARVMDGVGTPEMLYRPGMSPHHHALRPGDVRAIERAEVVFWVGPVMTPWLERALDGADARSVVLMAADGVGLLAARNGGHAHGHDDHDDDAGHDEAHDEHEHDEGHADNGGEDGDAMADDFGTDPHIWLSPDNGAAMMQAMAEALAAQDPENAQAYRANAAAGAAALAEQSERIAALLDGATPVFITGHDALHYFEHRFGAEMQAAISETDDAAPGAAHLAEVKAALAGFDHVCVLVEPGFALKLVDVVVPRDRRTVVEVDQLAASGTPDFARYQKLMDDLAAAIGACSEG